VQEKTEKKYMYTVYLDEKLTFTPKHLPQDIFPPTARGTVFPGPGHFSFSKSTSRKLLQLHPLHVVVVKTRMDKLVSILLFHFFTTAITSSRV